MRDGSARFSVLATQGVGSDGKYIRYVWYTFAVATTTVKVSETTNRKLDALQARLRLRSGKKMTKDSIIQDLVERALEADEPLILLKAPKYPLPDKVWRKVMEIPFDWGVETKEEDIDRILYGDSE